MLTHHKGQKEKADKMHSILVKRAYRTARKAGVSVTREQLDNETDTKLTFIIQAAKVAAHV